MKKQTSAERTVRWSLIGLGLLLPVLTLIPLGSLWLWQNGWLLPWALVVCATTVAAWAVQRRLLSSPKVQDAIAAGDSDAADAGQPPDPSWTPAEISAWSAVEEISRTVDTDTLTSREAVLALGTLTVEAVAARMKPGKSDPLLQFTAPEALALIERVSARMNTFLRESVPLGDRLTVAQMMMLYRWRGSIELAEKAYDIWRAIRVLNPMTAVTSEIRERLSKEMMAWGRKHVTQRLARVYVEEVGRAAIDLYSGRLRVDSQKLGAHVTTSSARDLAATATAKMEPLRLLVAGKVSAGKSSLVNALASEVKAAVDALPATAEFTPYRLQREGVPAALVIDSPGLTDESSQTARLVERADDCDLVLWVAAANRADREVDRCALTAIRDHFAARPNRRRPPMLLVLSHIDRLRPFDQWSPPYDLADTSSAKAASIRAATEAAAEELSFSIEDVVPVCLSEEIGRYNVDAVWAEILEMLPEAQRAQLVRTLREAEGQWDWQKLWSQIKSGGRVVVRTALKS
jgi:predicted GTPase